jgi:serine/threonine protein kinase/tetratricopeptide (TPR) repeat protein
MSKPNAGKTGENLAKTITVDDGQPIEREGTLIGRYKLLQKIGEGGFGTVYMAEQEEPVRRRVALKIIKPGMDTKQIIARFEAERQALAMMEHPNIAKVFDAGATGVGRPYFVMELVKGVPITEYCDRNRLGTKERLELFMDVCGAVQHAHQKGIIHRDLKPSNVMVTLHDVKPVPKIIDFGIAKATNQRLTERTLFTEYNQFIGTPAYISPEQAEMSGLDVDTRSDIYSLGVLLYELLTGTTPIDPKNLSHVPYTELQRIIREEDPQRPSLRISTQGREATGVAELRKTDLQSLTRALRGDLDWVVMKALEKDRTRRYETAEGLSLDIRRYLGNEPVSARPPSTIYRLGKFVRRNRAAVTVATVVTAAMMAGFFLAAAGFFQARREANATKAINEFFNGTLASVDPLQLHEYSGFTRNGHADVKNEGGLVHNISVLEMMLRARDKIGASFVGKPALEATARETIGLSLLGLGRPRDAAEELAEAAGIRRKVLGPNHPDTLRSELQFGFSLNESGRAPEAIPMLAELRKKMIDKYGQDDPRALQASSLYANALVNDRRHEEAEPLFRETLEMQRQVLGEDHRDTMETMAAWADSYMWQGRGAEAEELTRPVYETALRKFGPDDVLTLWGQTLLGWSRNFQGDRKQGEELLRPAVEGLVRVLGHEHPYTCRAKNGLGRSIQNRGGGEERERLWKEALEGLRASEGKASPAIYVTSRDLAFVLIETGKREEGIHLLRRAVQDFRAKYGEDHTWTLDNLDYLREGLLMVGEVSEAAEVGKQALVYKSREAEKPGASASSLNSFAWALLTMDPPELRDPAKALPFAERAVKLTEGTDRYSLDTLALALHLTGRNDEAIVAQRKAISLVPGGDPVNRADLSTSLVKYLSAGGGEREAKEVIRKCVRSLEAASDSAADFVLKIGRFSNRLEETLLFPEAESARREALASVRNHWTNDPAAIAGLLYRIGRALLHQGRAVEAEAVLREGVAYASKTDDEEALARNQVNLAEALLYGGRHRGARKIAMEMIDRREKLADHGSDKSPLYEELTMEARRLLGMASLGEGEAHAAEPILREVAEWFRRTQTADSWRRARAQGAWGECLLALQRFDEAEPILLQSLTVLEREVGRTSTMTQDAIRRIRRLNEARGK